MSFRFRVFREDLPSRYRVLFMVFYWSFSRLWSVKKSRVRGQVILILIEQFTCLNLVIDQHATLISRLLLWTEYWYDFSWIIVFINMLFFLRCAGARLLPTFASTWRIFGCILTVNMVDACLSVHDIVYSLNHSYIVSHDELSLLYIKKYITLLLHLLTIFMVDLHYWFILFFGFQRMKANLSCGLFISVLITGFTFSSRLKSLQF